MQLNRFGLWLPLTNIFLNPDPTPKFLAVIMYENEYPRNLNKSANNIKQKGASFTFICHKLIPKIFFDTKVWKYFDWMRVYDRKILRS